jgi:light-regulated signal transduction histidine kinase (bacteriophytochrome)
MTMGAAFLRRVLPRNDDPTSRVVDALQRSAHRMSRTVASFADLAKLQMGEIELDMRRTPVGDLVQSAFDVLLPEARAENSRLTLDIDRATSAVMLPCDPPRVTQTLWHLFACVSYVLPAASEVVLRARHDTATDAVRFDVEGKRPEEAPRRPLSGDLHPPELTIARGLVALHGGTLESDCQDDTIRVSFSIPVSPASAPRTARGEGVDGN